MPTLDQQDLPAPRATNPIMRIARRLKLAGGHFDLWCLRLPHYWPGGVWRMDMEMLKIEYDVIQSDLLC